MENNMKKAILIVILILILGLSLMFFIKKQKTDVYVIDEIEGYVLENNKSGYYNELFNELKTLLNKEYTEEEYLEIVAKLFVTDVYSLTHALSKNDVGGMQYVYESFREDFKKIAKSSIYDGVESNIYGNRKQSLPEVTSVSITSIEDEKFTIASKKQDVYKVSVDVYYKKDLGYPSSLELLIFFNNNKPEVIKMD